MMLLDKSFDESSNTTLLKLPAAVTGDNVEALVDEVLAQRNNNLALDAADVERFDTPCVEAILAASKLWKTDRCSVRISNPSSKFNDIISMLGLEQSDFETGAS